MTNFIFKSANRLIKNSPLTEDYIMTKLESIQKELRHQKQDNKDISLKLDRLLIDKHLQMQVDEYFEDGSGSADPGKQHPEDKPDLD